MKLLFAFALCAVGCAPSNVNYRRADAPPVPEPAGERYLDRVDIDRTPPPPLREESAPARRE